MLTHKHLFTPPRPLSLFCIDHRPHPRRGVPGLRLGVGPDSRSFLNDAIAPGIPRLNPFLNEATGIYWVWKHLGDRLVGNPSYIGFCHYRRFFASAAPSSCRVHGLERLLWRFHIDTPKTLRRLLTDKNVDGLVAEHCTFLEETVAEQFIHNHGSQEFLYEAFARMRKRMPEYAADFGDYLEGNIFFPYNMFVVRTELFRQMCEATFPVILPLEQRLRELPQELRPASPRTAGYIYERMSGAFWFALMRHGRRFSEIPVLWAPSLTDRFLPHCRSTVSADRPTRHKSPGLGADSGRDYPNALPHSVKNTNGSV